jgi:hypothetical protein
LITVSILLSSADTPAVDSADGIPNVPRLPEFYTNRIPNFPASKPVNFDAVWEVM